MQKNLKNTEKPPANRPLGAWIDALEAVFGDFQSIFNGFFWTLRNI